LYSLLILIFYIFDSAQEKMDEQLSSDEEYYFRRRKKRLQEEQQQQERPRQTWGGSKKGKKPNVERGRQRHSSNLHDDYFCENPVCDERIFRRRFRMRPTLFARIKQDLLQHHNNTWKVSVDCCGVGGFSTEQKLTSCLWVCGRQHG
jgi:hypothetical protein